MNVRSIVLVVLALSLIVGLGIYHYSTPASMKTEPLPPLPQGNLAAPVEFVTLYREYQAEQKTINDLMQAKEIKQHQRNLDGIVSELQRAANVFQQTHPGYNLDEATLSFAPVKIIQPAVPAPDAKKTPDASKVVPAKK